MVNYWSTVLTNKSNIFQTKCQRKAYHHLNSNKPQQHNVFLGLEMKYTFCDDDDNNKKALKLKTITEIRVWAIGRISAVVYVKAETNDSNRSCKLQKWQALTVVISELPGWQNCQSLKLLRKTKSKFSNLELFVPGWSTLSAAVWRFYFQQNHSAEMQSSPITPVLFHILCIIPLHLHLTFNHLADAFIQSDVQMRRTIEAIRPSREQQYTSAMTSLR